MFQMPRVGFALLFGTAALMRLQAQSTAEAAAPLAVRISSLLPPHATVSLEFQNLAPLRPAESSSFRGALQQELRKTGVEIAPATQPELRLRVVISENPHGLLFVAEISSKDARQIAMLPWNAPAPTEATPHIKIVKKPVWEQGEPVLDFMLLDSESQLVVLGANRITGYRLTDGKWTPTSQASLTPARPLPRDPRGRLEMAAGALRAYMPGTTCIGVTAPALRLTCAAGNESWPLNPRDAALQVRWVMDRNTLESEGVRGAFYNAAPGLLAATDGKIEDRANEQVVGAEKWGSDLAGIENPCGSNILLIATMASDALTGDQIQVYEIANGQAASASEALPVLGPVTALWPAETAGQATLVVRNSKTGNYEASRLGLACAE
jgi:hypothetical protein